MIYVYITMLLMLNVCWLASVLLTVPGNWLMVLTTFALAWWKWDAHLFGVPVLVLIAVLAAIGEIIEFFAGAGGAKKAGASWIGALAAIGGAVVGALMGTVMIPIPVAGTMLGACLGAGAAVWVVERLAGKTPDKSLKSGIGAGTGVLVGITVKFAIGCLIWLIIAVAVFWN